jgi:hypothetical protein
VAPGNAHIDSRNGGHESIYQCTTLLKIARGQALSAGNMQTRSEHCRGCTSGARLSSEAPAAERLQQAAVRKAAHIERLRAEVQAAEQAACTFAPQLATAGICARIC